MKTEPDYDKERNKILSRILGKLPVRFRMPAVAIVLIILAFGTILGIIVGVKSLVNTEQTKTEEEKTDPDPQFITLEVAKEYSESWSDWTYVAKDERAQCRVIFTNENSYKVKNVKLTCVLTDNIEIVDGITLYDDKFPDGYSIEGQIENEGVNIGDYSPGESVEVFFYIKAIDPSITEAECITASVSINGNSYHQSAEIDVWDSNGGWGDNTNGRRAYSSDEIDAGKLGSLITFNSISDGLIGHEFNYVGARQIDETNGWHANTLEVEDGETYTIRLYIHNDNPGGFDAVAKDVKVTFSLPTQFSKQQNIIGYLDSSNAVPTRYWDGVTLKSDRYFFIEYLDGSARLCNEGIGKDEWIPLPNEIITKDGALVGYSALDGQIPGGYDYYCEVQIDVKVHMKD